MREVKFVKRVRRASMKLLNCDKACACRISSALLLGAKETKLSNNPSIRSLSPVGVSPHRLLRKAFVGDLPRVVRNPC